VTVEAQEEPRQKSRRKLAAARREQRQLEGERGGGCGSCSSKRRGRLTSISRRRPTTGQPHPTPSQDKKPRKLHLENDKRRSTKEAAPKRGNQTEVATEKSDQEESKRKAAFKKATSKQQEERCLQGGRTQTAREELPSRRSHPKHLQSKTELNKEAVPKFQTKRSVGVRI
jgi:hypothetical protein